MTTKYLSPEEREEYASLLDDALNGSRQADVAAVDRMEQMLAQADRIGREWPALLYRYWQREGMRNALKAHAKAQSRALVAHDGRLVSKDTRRGVLRETEDGRQSWQQVLFIDMTWDEFDQFRRRNADDIAALEINEVMAQKIDALRVLAPDSTGIGDACEQIGTTLEAVLAA
jgi:hypothetical protein